VCARAPDLHKPAGSASSGPAGCESWPECSSCASAVTYDPGDDHGRVATPACLTSADMRRPLARRRSNTYRTAARLGSPPVADRGLSILPAAVAPDLWRAHQVSVSMIAQRSPPSRCSERFRVRSRLVGGGAQPLTALPESDHLPPRAAAQAGRGASYSVATNLGSQVAFRIGLWMCGGRADRAA
jgi:hypothetical protein